MEQYIQNLLPVIRMRERRNEEDYRRLQHELQAGKVRPVYIFYGREEFLLAEAVESLADALLPRGIRDDGCIRVGGSSTTVREIVSMANTPSLFSENVCLLWTMRRISAKSATSGIRMIWKSSRRQSKR